MRQFKHLDEATYRIVTHNMFLIRAHNPNTLELSFHSIVIWKAHAVQQYTCAHALRESTNHFRSRIAGVEPLAAGEPAHSRRGHSRNLTAG